MSRIKVLLWLAVMLSSICLIVSAASTPQQNISGGGSVAITQGGNTAVVSAGGALRVDPSAVTQPVSGPLTDAQLRASAVPISGSLSSTPLTGCGSTNYDSGIVTVPSSTTTLTSTATCVNTVILINLTTSQQTCTVTDGQGTPANLLPPSYDLPAKSDAVFNRYGVKALSGIKWSCTNASAVAGIVRGQQ